ncbi:MAG: element excision factor XisI family protein [Microcoleus sp.]|uniref:element excision factor XisI family protein n=1 Tax=Microcoleus sp. TaxID=44472 RepID=UPI003C72CB96
MDTRLRYQENIKIILQEHANFRNTIPDGYHSQLLFDDERGGYLVLNIGWNDDNYLHATPIHLDLIGDRIRIQYDDTEEGVATDLLADYSAVEVASKQTKSAQRETKRYERL